MPPSRVGGSLRIRVLSGTARYRFACHPIQIARRATSPGWRIGPRARSRPRTCGSSTTPQVIELSLPFGSFLRLGIRRSLGAVFGILVLPVAAGLGTPGGGFAAGHLTVETA